MTNVLKAVECAPLRRTTCFTKRGVSGGEGANELFFWWFEKNISKVLDKKLGVVHNLASLLLTTKRSLTELSWRGDDL